MLAPHLRRPLTAQLEDARKRGMLGPGPVGAHLDHAEAMAAAVDGDFRGRLLDLGSGGGVPGVILLAVWPAATGVLLDARQRRCSFLEVALRGLGLSDRGAVACGRAEALAGRGAGRIGPARPGAAAQGGSRGRRVDGRGTTGGALAAARGGSRTTPVVVRPGLKPGDRDVSRETRSHGRKGPRDLSRETPAGLG